MKIALIQIDGKMPNLALMKLARYHKDKGDDVIIIDISDQQYDRIYGSKIFMGGSGYDLKAELPKDIELLTPDYEKFKLDHSIGFTSRGCIRDCGFCIVREKEGDFKDVNMGWIKHNKVIVMDNNFLASCKWKEKLQFFIDNKIKVNFNQGLDIRLINKENAEMLAKVKSYDHKFNRRAIYFAFDNIAFEDIIKTNTQILINAGIKSNWIMFYVLCGYDTTLEQDLKRIEIIKDLGCIPYVMRYHKKDPILNKLSKYINRRYYQIMSWEDFRK